MRRSLALICFLLLALFACQDHARSENAVAIDEQVGQAFQDDFSKERREMVEQQIRARGITDDKVLKAMRKVPRHLFVPEPQRKFAYADSPLPIGLDQTISQPYIVAYMTEAAKIASGGKVLEIGTGSGYQAAILGEIAKEVYTIEIVPELARQSGSLLKDLGYKNVYAKEGNGYLGWPEHAPFDAIVVTAAPPEVPKALVDQLAVGGIMVIPVGTSYQEMMLITKTKDGVTEKRTIPVRFVPMTGRPRS